MATARQIVTRALRLIQVLGADEPGDSAEVVGGFDVLNTIWNSYSLGRLFLLSGINADFPITAGVNQYQIGPGQTFDSARPAQLIDGSFVRWQNIDYPIGYIGQSDYNSIPFKNQPGIPSTIYYEPGATGGTLTLFPVPLYDMTLHLAATLPFDQFVDLDTSYDLPPGYDALLAYALAVELAPEYGKEASVTVLRMMANYKRQVKRSNAEIPQLDMPAGIPTNGWYGYPWWVAG